MSEGMELLISEDQGVKREVISAITFQYSAPVQRLKAHSLCQIFLKLLFLHHPDEFVSLQVLRQEYSAATRGGHISRYEAGQVLRRLCSDNKALKAAGDEDGYRLKENVRLELEHVEAEAERELGRVLDLFFSNGLTQTTVYREALVTIVSQVAATMGEESASYLLRRRSSIPYDPDLLEKLILGVVAADQRLDRHILRRGVIDFLKSTDTSVQSLLWQVTEAYFVTRMLGMDVAGNSLSREVFRKAEFILDTNVLLSLLLDADEDHELTLATIRAIRSLNLPLVVALGTLDETKMVVERDLSRLEALVAQGQDTWLNKSDSPILREYHRLQPITTQDFRERLTSLEERLVQRFGVDLRGFRRPTEAPDYETLVNDLRIRYQRGNPNRRLKSEPVAQHDADLLLMVQERRETSDLESWVLTLDTSLPGAVPVDSSHFSLALGPRTVIQWLAPVVHQATLKDEFPRVFAEMVRGRFLPRTQFLTDGDLSVLVHFQEVIDQLPDDDVEHAVSIFMSETTRADLSEAEGVLAFSGIIQSVISEPNSLYQRALQNQEIQAIEIKKDLSEVTQRAERLAREREEERRAAEEARHALQQERDRAAEREGDFRHREGVIRFWAFWSVIVSLVPILFFYGLGLPVWERFSQVQYIFIEIVILSSLVFLARSIALPSAVGRNNLPYLGPNYRKVVGE